MDHFFTQVLILILLPLIPAGLMFKLFRDHGKAEGSMFGFRWSFGGAFAGYLLILFVLWGVMRGRMNPPEAEVWTVHGKIDPGNLKDIANRVEIKSIPQSLHLEEDGGYEFRVIVLRRNDNLEFPRVKIDLTRLCGGVKLVQLDETSGTFDALPNVKSLKISKKADARLIDISPIELPTSPSTELCGEQG